MDKLLYSSSAASQESKDYWQASQQNSANMLKFKLSDTYKAWIASGTDMYETWFAAEAKAWCGGKDDKT